MDYDPIKNYARNQHHVVARWEILDMGYDEHHITELLDAEELYHVHEDVYVVDAVEPTFYGRCKAATLAIRDGVITGLTAAMLYGIWPIDESRPIDIAVSDDPADSERLARQSFAARADDRAAIRRRSASA